MTEKQAEKKNYLTYVLVALLVAAAFISGQLYNRVKTLEKQVGTGGQTQGGGQPTTPAKVELKITDDDPYKGEKNAKVTVVELADFQCPFCGAYAGLNEEIVKIMQQRAPGWQPAEPGIIADYVKTGKVKLVWKDYPFLGQESVWAAAAARCAADQGKFWEYHDYLFSHQKGENEGAFAKENLKKFAIELKLDSKDFDACVDSGKYEAKMQEALTYGQSVGVRGTPATFINGKLYSGALPYSDIKAAIEEELKK